MLTLIKINNPVARNEGNGSEQGNNDGYSHIHGSQRSHIAHNFFAHVFGKNG